MNIIIKRFIAFALSFVLVIVPSFASYNPNKPHTRWYYDSLINDPTVKSTVEVKAQRTYPVVVYDPETAAKNTINKPQKTSIKVTANANKVGKTLFKRSPAGAITQAVTAILGKAVDWVLDPENNSVDYKEIVEVGGGYNWSVQGNPKSYALTAQLSCQNYVSNHLKAYGDYAYHKVVIISDTTATCFYTKNGGALVSESMTRVGTEPITEEITKSIPINTVAQKVIQHADEGQAPAMQVMADTALDALEAGELDDDLEAGAEPKQYGANEYAPGTEPNPETPTDPENPTDPETPTDPENPNPDPMPTEWPAFCDWATPVCDFIEWVKAEPEQTDTEIDLQEPDEQPTDTNFDFGGSCPAPIVFEGSIFGQSIEFTMLDTVMLCDFLSTYVKWPVYAASSLFAIYIVGGRKENG